MERIACVSRKLPSFEAVVSFDPDWSREPKGAASLFLRDGKLDFTSVGERVKPLEYLSRLDAENALVLLDIPVFGTSGLSRQKPFRKIDRLLMKMGIPLLPSYKAGNTGELVAREILREYPGYLVVETYPYAVLKFLWNIRDKPEILGGPLVEVVERLRWVREKPPKYKRARSLDELRSSCELIKNLIVSFLPGLMEKRHMPPLTARRADLMKVSHIYDSLIALIAGIHFAKGSPWSVLVSLSGEDASILMLMDSTLRKWASEVSAL